MDFLDLDKAVESAVAADEKYLRENDAKFRAIEQKVATYDEFRDMVKASHLTPLEKKEKIIDPNIQYKKVIWNSVVTENKEEKLLRGFSAGNKHFTEK